MTKTGDEPASARERVAIEIIDRILEHAVRARRLADALALLLTTEPPLEPDDRFAMQEVADVAREHLRAIIDLADLPDPVSRFMRQSQQGGIC